MVDEVPFVGQGGADSPLRDEVDKYLRAECDHNHVQSDSARWDA